MAYAEKLKLLAKQNNDLHDEVKAMYYQSYALTNKGLIDSSLSIANMCMQFLSNKINDPGLKANLQNQKGRCYMRKNQYKEAIAMGYQVIVGGEKIKDTLLQMKGKTLIGWAYLEMGQIKEALTWHLKALYTTNDSLLLEKYGILFANLALNYNDLGKKDSAFFFIQKAIYYSRKNENLFALSNSLAIQAQLYVRSGQTNLAENPLKEVIRIRELIGDPFYIVSDMSQLALYYAHNGQPQKGILVCDSALLIAKEYKIGTKLFFIYTTLAENYKALGNTEKYAEILNKIITLKDSVYATNSALALAEMQAKYDVTRKENTIVKQKLDIAQRNNLLYGSMAFLIFSFTSIYILFTNYRKKQKLKAELLLNEEKRQRDIAIKNAAEKERKRIAADLHDNMGAYATAIIATVDDIITNRNLQDESVFISLKTNAGELMNNLRDTIWASNKEKINIIGISDRFKVYLQTITPAFPNINVEIEENIAKDISFSPVQALNIFRILQEAFTNAARHSNGNLITITISCNEVFKIIIEDNGVGIKNIDTLKKGNGFLNMKSRATESGFTLSTIKKFPNGTQIILTG
ncbi:MAG: hypothetical protein M3004_03665 [Bacteroidota bacterium]|nr:hypothetical protein [Bacteroidota bacterium]